MSGVLIWLRRSQSQKYGSVTIFLAWAMDIFMVENQSPRTTVNILLFVCKNMPATNFFYKKIHLGLNMRLCAYNVQRVNVIRYAHVPNAGAYIASGGIINALRVLHAVWGLCIFQA